MRRYYRENKFVYKIVTKIKFHIGDTKIIAILIRNRKSIFFSQYFYKSTKNRNKENCLDVGLNFQRSYIEENMEFNSMENWYLKIVLKGNQSR